MQTQSLRLRQDSSKTVLILSAVLFCLGLLLGGAFTVATVWADLEAALFDPSLDADEALSSLRCPVLITGQETGQVSATFANSSSRALLRTVRAHISYGFVTLMREEEEQFTLEPGESRRLEWAVTAEDAAWRHFVLVRINELRNSPLPSRTGTCGILVLNVPGLSGNQVVFLAGATAVLSMIVGVVLWAAGRRAASKQVPDLTRSMSVLVALMLAAMVISSRGQWMVGGLLLIFSALILVTMVTWAISRAT